MTREQAQAILENRKLIEHFAAGGDIGHIAHDYAGRFVAIWPAKKINLSNLRPGEGTNYVRVKSKWVWNGALRCYERHTRCWPEKIKKHELITN